MFVHFLSSRMCNYLAVLLMLTLSLKSSIAVTAQDVAEVQTNGNSNLAQTEYDKKIDGSFSDIFAAAFKNILQSLNNLDVNNDKLQSSERDPSLEDILTLAHKMANDGASKKQRSLSQLIDHFKSHMDESVAMMEHAFAHVDFSKLSIASLWYYVEQVEQVRTPSWKRRVHRFHKRISVDTILELHDILYLMEVAYLPTEKLIKEHVNKFRNGTYEVVSAITSGTPTEPAHFVMIPKKVNGKKLGDIPKEKSIAEFWNDITNEITKSSSNALEVVLAIRGTGDLGDIISDSMLNATAYRHGMAHDGISRSGKYIVGKYIDEIKKLLQASGRSRAEVTLIGYSLGAGVAAIVAMELNEYDFIDAHSIGFGCPALLDLDQSEETKSYITTIVTDSDIVPRMSGPSVANVLVEIMSYDWTDSALRDLRAWLDQIDLPLDKNGIMTWANDTLNMSFKPYFETVKQRMKQVLYPPGNCIHLWRNGAGWSGTHTPCSFFDSVEFSRTLLDDHLLEPGYHPALLGLAREEKSDLNFHFDHDLMALSALL